MRCGEFKSMEKLALPQGGKNMSEWKPRGRNVVLGDIPWLARVADKARALVDGTIGEYIYP